MATLRSILTSAIVTATLALTAACGSSTGSSPAVASSQVSTSVAAPASPKPTPRTCASDPAGTTYVTPQAIVPRVDGIFVGHEDGGYLVVLRYYPDNTVFLAVVPGNTPINNARAWVQPHPKSNTGPFPHDTSGAFVKPVPAGDIDYSIWKYTGSSLNLHAVSHHGCREHTILMTFIAD